MSEEVQTTEKSTTGMDRRSVLKAGALIAGAAAFATPVVTGVFSSPAAAAFSRCDPTVDSDAIDLLPGGSRKWNINCDRQNTRSGRWNAQRSSFTIPGTNNVKAEIVFGLEGTDNFPVECAYYTISVPTGWECEATWALERASGGGCVSPLTQALSTPGICAPPHANFNPPTNPTPIVLPYCRDIGANPNECVENIFLVLTDFYCCPA